ncbi:histidine kinase, partial [Amycolatopsis sp. A24]
AGGAPVPGLGTAQSAGQAAQQQAAGSAAAQGAVEAAPESTGLSAGSTQAAARQAEAAGQPAPGLSAGQEPGALQEAQQAVAQQGVPGSPAGQEPGTPEAPEPTADAQQAESPEPKLQGDIFANETQPPAEEATPTGAGSEQGALPQRTPKPALPQPSRPEKPAALPQPALPQPTRRHPDVFQESGQLPLPNGRPAAPPSSLPSRKATETPAPRREESVVEATTEWNFGTDDGWRAVQAVSQSAPSTFTSAGLPRRRRGEQLLPGSAGPSTGATAPRPQRDAHDVRGRLRSFQQGIERGRHRTAQAAENNHETLEGE